MEWLVIVLVCVGAIVADDNFLGGINVPTVCVEFRPGPSDRPTKVCGPIVPGGLPKAAEPLIYNIREERPTVSDDEPETNCGQQALPSYQSRQMPQQPQFQGPPMMRMEGPPEGMIMPPPSMPMEFENNPGWRQANSEPCPTSQRSSPPSFSPFLGGSRFPFGLPNSRSWIAPQQQPIMQMRTAEESKTPPQSKATDGKLKFVPAQKDSLDTLLKECEEKTKLLQEKEAMIQELKNQMSKNEKKESENLETSITTEP